jgi:nitrate reductase (NAD(P)H)
MTLGFSELAVGDFVELKGPIGHFIWKGAGIALLHGKERRVREMGMVCGGSGITPILQVLRGILHDVLHRDTKVWVLDVNRCFGDILCRKELHQLVGDNTERFQLHHTLTGTDVPEDWEYSTGRPDNAMLKTRLPAPAEDSMVCIWSKRQEVSRCTLCPMDGDIITHPIVDSLVGIGWDLSSIVIF